MMTNIINYSGATEFAITLENAPGRSRITFIDDGAEYNPLTHRDPDASVPPDQRPEGGLGILITKRLTDAVSYTRHHERNVLSIIKYDKEKSIS